MNANYHVRIRGRALGPYALDAIRQMTRRGQVGRTHEVSTDGLSWAPATAFPEIFERSAAAGFDPGGGAVHAGAGTPTQSRIWHYTRAGAQQPAPIDEAQLVNLIASGQVGPEDFVWCESMAEWSPVSHVPELAMHALPAVAPAAGTGFPEIQAGLPGGLPDPSRRSSSGGQSPFYRQFVGKKTGAGICALLLGALGVHKFMLGLTTGGLTMLLLFCLVIPIPVLSVIAFAEAIIYLTKSDEQFFRDYAVDKKQWF